MTYDDGFPPSSSPGDERPAERSTVVVASSVPLSLATGRVEHPSIPEGAVGLGTFIEDRLLGRQAMSEETVPTYEVLLSVPRRLAYVAYDKEDGSVEGQLAALVDPGEIAEMNGKATEDAPDEPWKASVPSFEAGPRPKRASGGADGGDENLVALLPLGLVVRMSQRRVHPDDLAAEAADVLRSVVNEGAVEIVDQFLDTI